MKNKMINEEKKAKRKIFISKRQSLSFDEKSLRDEKISQLIIRSDLFNSCDTLLAYYPVRNEINILPVIEAAFKMNKKVALPKTYQGGIMDFRYISSFENLAIGPYGIPEPCENNELFNGRTSSLCIVPALSYDFCGYRLGYGGGYYDRFLSSFLGRAVGVVYSDFIIERLPHDKNDVPVSALITEGGVINCKNE